MSLEEHTQAILNVFSNRVLLTRFEPLTWEEFLTLSQSEDLKAMSPDVGTRLWLIPVQRFLQEVFRIEPTAFSATTLPPLSELEEDFKVAATITIDKFSLNVEDLYGVESVKGAARTWNHNIPQHVMTLLSRYERPGGRSERV